MAGTLFFVHGTGVRDSGYRETLRKIGDGCKDQPRLAGVHVADNCSWGERIPDTSRVTLTLPPDERTRALQEAPTEAEIDQAAWELLLFDHLFELRIAGQQPVADGSVIGRQQPDVLMQEVLSRLAGAPPVLDGVELARLADSARTLAASPELAAASKAAGDVDDPELVELVARALLAGVLGRPEFGEARPLLALDRASRDRAVEDLAKAIAPTTKGLRSWVKGKISDTVKGLATGALADRREGLTAGAAPKVGDIFFHLRRGSEILEFIAEKIADCDPPVVAVGHSLGGVMLVDLLSRQTAPQIAKLVTVGSQAPLFYALDSLENLRPGNATPSPLCSMAEHL